MGDVPPPLHPMYQAFLDRITSDMAQKFAGYVPKRAAPITVLTLVEDLREVEGLIRKFSELRDAQLNHLLGMLEAIAAKTKADTPVVAEEEPADE